MKANLKCAKCNSDELEILDMPDVKSKATCGKCGADRTYGKFTRSSGSTIKKSLKEQLEELLR